MKILEVVTEHTAPFKILFEVLKDMLTETNIEIRAATKKNKADDDEYQDDEDLDELETETEGKKKKEERNCMKINAIDHTKSVLINLKLDGNNFSTFDCKKSKLLLGVNLGCFYKLIKSMGKNDILSLSVENESKNYLKIKVDSPDEKKDSEFNLKLLDLDEVKMAIPEITFDAVITMDSQEFNKLCREMNNIADYVEIKCLNDKIIFTCKGDYADRKTTYRTSAGKDEDENENILVSINHASTQKGSTSPQIVQGIYELKNLVLFSKCASLCNDIEIYMRNDFPLVIKYTVATLGRILLCLTPIKEDTTKNANYSDEEQFYSDDDE
ncbi:proliferating cell nuclear antigen [Fadolivirus algeromassiliense]|jgi:proliferating cell nuclear antigen PCNA|uniref:Proliferating cell nuclear antigen n=1 Tax=Fadolivirus FV1/VV64 TaxID=3070911 RepID=A0A7D3UV92_9VIRU|nr:proliferating cell nuclear antigen [Fadolivirus algeromassiliense]QKF94029.1 proliferating cell nuclear antigen [Fadolivirus FV1/VV64]